MNEKYDAITMKFRKKQAKTKIQAVSLAVTLALILHATMSWIITSIPSLNTDIMLFGFIIIILVLSLVIYTYLSVTFTARNLRILDPILLDECDAEAYCNYLEATNRFEKKSISPAFLEAYLSGLSYTNDKEKMRDMYYRHGSFLAKNINTLTIRFNQKTPLEQIRDFDEYYEVSKQQLTKKLSKRFPKVLDEKLKTLQIKRFLLEEKYEEAWKLLQQVDTSQEKRRLLDQVSWHYQCGFALTKLKRIEEAKPYIEYVIKHGNTTYYVKEAEYLQASY